MRTRLLVVDDDPTTTSLVRHLLARDEFDVETAADGAEAMAILRDPERTCRIVVSDWNMPRVSGVELCAQVRAEEFPGYVYFILLTNRLQPGDVVAGFAAGADDYVPKPFEPQELRARVAVGRRMVALETRDMVLFALARLAEARDPDAGDHLERIRHYSRILARQLIADGRFAGRLDGSLAQQIFLTSPLHDIGKIAIPDGVLLKPGSLTADERRVMQTHTTIGAETLAAVIAHYPDVEYLRVARDITLHHHERWDGGGYPAGLAGEAIPLAARIVAVADFYDALRSHRVYKPERPHHEARELMVAAAGTHFDPVVIDAFLASEDRFQAVATQFAAPSPPPLPPPAPAPEWR